MSGTTDPSETITDSPLYAPVDGCVFDAAFSAVAYSFRNPNARGGGAIGKASVICEVLGIDPDMPLSELRRRLA